MPIDDPTLIAYLDGQLDDAACARLEAALQTDADASARLDRLARSADLARRSFGPVLEEPVPPRLIDAIWRAPDPRQRADAGARQRPEPASIGSAGWGWVRSWWNQDTRWPAVAAGGALASLASLVAVLTWPAGPWQAGDAPERWALQTGTTVSDAALQRVLDTAASGSRLQTPQGVTSLVASFETTAGPCREIGRTTADGGQSELAVVCRTGSDRWQVVFAEAGASAGYVTASSQRQERADAVLEKLKARPLDDAAEQALLGSGWRR